MLKFIFWSLLFSSLCFASFEGDPVKVVNGGTQTTSTTAYGVVLGGTTSTSPFQNAGTGTTGQVLLSMGSTAPPAWTTTTGGTIGTATMSGGQTQFSGSAGSFTTVSAAAFSSKTLTGAATNPTTNSNLGFTFATLLAGAYDAIFSAPMIADSALTIGNTTVCAWIFHDSAGNSYGFSEATSDGFSVTNHATDTVNTLKGYFNYGSNQTNLEIDVQYELVSGSGTCLIDSSNAFAQPTLTLRPSGGAPQNNVSSSSTGNEHVERAMMGASCTSGTCTSVTSTPGISSITWSSTGVYSVNFLAGTFSAAPTCTCNSNDSFAHICSPQSSSTSSVSMAIGNPGVNDTGNILCLGPR